MSWLTPSNILLLLGAIDTVAVGILGTLYFRKLGGEVATARLMTLRVDHIAEAESYIGLLKIEILDLQGRLKLALEMLGLAEAEAAKIKHKRELIG